MDLEAIVVLAASVLAVLVVVALLLRGERSRRLLLDAELAAARRQVEDLEQRLDLVSAEVAEARRAGAPGRPSDREYVITTIGEIEQTGSPETELGRFAPPPPPSPARLVEERLLDTLARQHDGSALRRRAVGAAVKVAAASHGVRRALRPDVRDRAAAEAYVARRRSRRARRQELREARRLLRVVRSREASTGPGTGTGAEDAA